MAKKQGSDGRIDKRKIAILDIDYLLHFEFNYFEPEENESA
jgi:hypothetical protein